MANPRQRRKLRSGTHKPVQHSRRAKKLLKKQPPIRGPKVLQEAWDGRKTVRQNYEALGLAASLNPIASGGTERGVSTQARREENCEKTEEGTAASASVATQPEGSGIRRGYGKIIRDAEGKIVDVQLADEDTEEEDAAMTAEGVEEVLDPRTDDQLTRWVGLGADGGRGEKGDTRVVQALEQLSAGGGGRVRRFTSQGELVTLQRLAAAHGDDLEAMARDRRLNADQRTAGELGRAIRKAGGIGVLQGRAGG